MKLTALGSSSAGNCFVMEFDMGERKKPVSLMVECGFPYQSIAKKANSYGIKISELDGCLISHSHKDHSIAASDLAKRGVMIHATQGTLDAIGLKGNGLPMRYGIPETIAPGVKAMAFRVAHDAPEPAGFIIKTKRETVIFGIDAERWVDDLSAFQPDYLLIEANYDETLMAAEQFALQKRATLSDIQRFRLNQRIKASHMSIKTTLRQVSTINKTNLKAIFLTHLSDHMSAPTSWKQQTTAISGVPCWVCRKDGGIE